MRSRLRFQIPGVVVGLVLVDTVSFFANGLRLPLEPFAVPFPTPNAPSPRP